MYAMSRVDPVRVSLSDPSQSPSPNASCSPPLGIGIPNGQQLPHEEYGKSQKGAEQEACGKLICDRKDNTWSDPATSCLLAAFEEKWNALGRGNLRSSNWEEVAVEVNLRCGVARTGDQCRHKMEKLRRKYREEKALKDRLIFSPSKWRWFERFELMLGDKQKEPDALLGNDTTPKSAGIDLHEHYASWNMPEGVVSVLKRPPPLHVQPGPPMIVTDYMPARNLRDDGSFTSPSQWEPNVDQREHPNPVKVRSKSVGKGNLKRRKESNEFVLAMKAFTEGLLKIEQYKVDQQKENERLRYEMELKRTEMLVGLELKRTQMQLDFMKAITGTPAKKVKKAETGSNLSETRANGVLVHGSSAVQDC
ncbi:hypothetical protein O6H91_05G131500 [Diphasiastrum complanatum]|uniref:Uncharacterized protein n=1 Tax=Diphasiastrum complanatum TaxID=34168 RepID=A0ACC2DTF0_DIPCM|nr:hypothetical protein O6H91_05G131500 [Diphasiastrum complanatum]